MVTIIDQIRQLSSFRVFYKEKPKTGARALPFNLDFTSASDIELNLELANNMNVIEYVQGIFIDNSSNLKNFTIQAGQTKQLLSVPAGSQALLPFFVPNTPKLHATSLGAVIVPIQLLTFEVQPIVWSAGISSSPEFIGQVSILGDQASDGSSTITTGGTAQSLFSSVIPTNGFSIYNPSPSLDLWINDSGTALANSAGSKRVAANGGWYETPPLYKPIGIISIIGSTTGQPFTANKW